MATWSEIESAAPELAGRARAAFDAHKHKVLATLRRDGSPRISGIEATIADGELWLGMMTGSRQALAPPRAPRLPPPRAPRAPPTRRPGHRKLARREGRARRPAPAGEARRRRPGRRPPPVPRRHHRAGPHS